MNLTVTPRTLRQDDIDPIERHLWDPHYQQPEQNGSWFSVFEANRLLFGEMDNTSQQFLTFKKVF